MITPDIQQEIDDGIPQRLGEWLGKRKAKRRNHAETLQALKLAESIIARVRVDILSKYDEWREPRMLCSRAQDMLHTTIELLEEMPPP